MKATAAVFARELAEKVFLVPAALVAGALPFALSLWPSDAMPRWTAEDRFFAAAWIAAALALVLSAILGSSVLAREMAEGRLRFFFSRPIGATSLWIGKMAAVAVAVWLSALLTVTPAILAGGIPQTVSLRWALTLLGVVPLLLLAHGISLSLRSRSPLALAVLAALAIAGMAIWMSFRGVQQGIPTRDLRAPGAAIAAIAAMLVLGLAGRRSVTRGRGDLRSGFRAFSRTLLIGAAALVLAAQGVSVWYASVPPSALSAVRETQGAPAGDWVFVMGPAPSRPGAVPAFVVDTRTRRSVSVRPSAWYWEPPTFSENGRRAAWLEPSASWNDGIWNDEPPREFDLVSADFGVEVPRRSATGLPRTYRPGGLLLSPDGLRAAVVTHRLDEGRRIGIYDLDGGRLLAVFDRPAARWLLAARFADSGRVTLIESASETPPVEVEIVDLRIDDRSSQVRVRFDLPARYPVVKRWSADQRRALVVFPSGQSNATLLVDLEDGRIAADLGAREASAFLFDGRIATSRADGAGSRIELLSPEGQLVRAWTLERRIVGIGPSPAASEIYLSTGGGFADSALLLRLDLDSGSLRELARGIAPIAPAPWQLDHYAIPRPGAPVTRLFVDAGSRLLRLDPQTGAQTVLFGSPQSGRPAQ